MNRIDAPLTVVRNVIAAPMSAAQSAYGMWRALGNSGTPQDFLDSLVGEVGPAAVANLSTNTSLGGSDILAPSQAAVKSYVDTRSAAIKSSSTPPVDTTVLWLDSEDFTISAWSGTAWVVVD